MRLTDELRHLVKLLANDTRLTPSAHELLDRVMHFADHAERALHSLDRDRAEAERDRDELAKLLAVRDKELAQARQGKALIGYRTEGEQEVLTAKGKRRYGSSLVFFFADGSKLRVTPQHNAIQRWVEVDEEKAP